MKAAGKRDVVVTLKGLHPNTKDQGVLDYLSKFGKILTTRVVHCTYSEGPLQGLKNGDRSFRLELKPGSNIPSYHVLFGQKVTLRYPGQKQTCARCFKSSDFCMGGGIAQKCEAAGRQKVELSQYILDMWKTFNYKPEEIEIASAFDDHGENESDQIGFSQSHQKSDTFTPPPQNIDPSRYGG